MVHREAVVSAALTVEPKPKPGCYEIPAARLALWWALKLTTKKEDHDGTVER